VDVEDLGVLGQGGARGGYCFIVGHGS